MKKVLLTHTSLNSFIIQPESYGATVDEGFIVGGPVGDFELLLCHGTVCVVGKMRDLILQLSKSSIYSTKPQHGVTGLYSNSLFKYHDNAYSCLEKCVEIGRGFIQKPYQKSKVLDYLWQGIFDFIKRYPDYKYLLGVLTIPGTFPEKEQKLIISFYNIYFSSTADFCSPIALFTAENVQDDTPFCGEDFRADWSMLNHLLREEGYELPWPFKQSAKWFSPGGSSILAFTKDDSFNSIAGLNLSSIDKLNESYVKHYLKD